MIYLLYVYLFILISSFLNCSLFFINEEALIFVSLLIFFHLVYKALRKIILSLFFYKIEHIYLVFCYLLTLSNKLITEILHLIKIYSINTHKLLLLEILTLMHVRLQTILVKENYYLKALINNTSLLLIKRIFILENRRLALATIKIKPTFTEFDFLMIEISRFKKLILKLYLKKA